MPARMKSRRRPSSFATQTLSIPAAAVASLYSAMNFGGTGFSSGFVPGFSVPDAVRKGAVYASTTSLGPLIFSASFSDRTQKTAGMSTTTSMEDLAASPCGFHLRQGLGVAAGDISREYPARSGETGFDQAPSAAPRSTGGKGSS